jgi:hypothetical protein
LYMTTKLFKRKKKVKRSVHLGLWMSRWDWVVFLVFWRVCKEKVLQ